MFPMYIQLHIEHVQDYITRHADTRRTRLYRTLIILVNKPNILFATLSELFCET